jgi:hypothetical protein
MVHSRTVSHTMFVLVALATAACGSYTSPAASTTGETTSNDSALVVSKASADAKTLTVTSSDGKCTDAFTLVDTHKSEVQALCKNGEVPVPSDASNTSCDEGQVTSITFKCVVAHMPPPRAQGCWQIEVKDDNHAIPANGANQFSALPPVICPMLGGAPPPPPFANGQGGQPSGQQGGQQPAGQGGPMMPGGPNAQNGGGYPGGQGGQLPPGAPGGQGGQLPPGAGGQLPPGMPGGQGGQQLPPGAPGGQNGQQPNMGQPNAGQGNAGQANNGAPNVPPPMAFQCCAPGADQNGQGGNGQAPTNEADSTDSSNAGASTDTK